MEPASLPPITPQPSEPTRFTVEQYLALVEAEELTEADRVELLEGVIVAMTPSGIRHSSGVARAVGALFRAVGDRAVIRPQLPLRVGSWSLPEPDVAVLPGTLEDYDSRLPSEALLVIEVSETSLATDRLSKARIYASSGVHEYWIVNLRENVVELLRDPDSVTAIWRDRRVARPGETIAVAAFPDAAIRVDDLLPRGDSPGGL